MAEDQPPASAADNAAQKPASTDAASSTDTATPFAASGPIAADAAASLHATDLLEPGDGGSTAADQAAIDELLKSASFEDANQQGAVAAPPPTEDYKLPNLQQAMQEAQVSSVDLLRDVELNVKIELGRSRMLVEDVLKLNEGSVVELDKLAGDPVDVFVNERLVARGEVLVLNDNFCVRINEIVPGVKEEGL